MYINVDKYYKIQYLIYSALFSVLATMTKQNIGLMLIIGITLSLILCEERKLKYFSPILYLIFCVISIISTSYILDFNLIDIYNVTFKNDAKGNKISLLTNLITNKQNFRQLSVGLVLSFSLIYFIKYQQSNYLSLILNKFNFFNNNKLASKKIILSITIILSIYLLYLISKNQKDIVICLALLTIGFYLSFELFDYKIRGRHLLCPFIFLVIANSFTSGLSQDDMIILCIPVIICINMFLELVLKAHNYSRNMIYLLIVSLIGINVFTNKINNPWSWFGANQSAVSYSNFISPYKELQGLMIDEQTFKLMNIIKFNIDKYSKRKNDILLYPNIPFFYILHNKIPPFITPVYWFDTASENKIDDLILNLNLKKPELIIFFDPPNFAYQEHSKMKKHEVRQSQFNYFIDNAVNLGIYKLIDYQVYQNIVGLENEIYESKFMAINPDCIGLTPKELIQKLKNENIYFENFRLQNSLKINDDSKIISNDVITINLKKSDIGKVAKLIGSTPKYNDFFYTLKVYKLNQ